MNFLSITRFDLSHWKKDLTQQQQRTIKTGRNNICLKKSSKPWDLIKASVHWKWRPWRRYWPLDYLKQTKFKKIFIQDFFSFRLLKWMIWAGWCYGKNPRTKLSETPFCLSTLTIDNLKLKALGLTFSLGWDWSYLYTKINVVCALGIKEIGEMLFGEFIRRPFV